MNMKESLEWEIDLKSNNILIIVEAGINHNDSIELAKKLIDVASDAGSDTVKYQTLKIESLI